MQAAPKPPSVAPPQASVAERFHAYRRGRGTQPLLLCGDAESVLRDLPDGSIDFCMTSPPYWGKRTYAGGGIGLEATPEQYVAELLRVFAQVKRVLKPTGSFWLNMGDTSREKSLLNLPWRVTIALTDQQGWVLRNTVVWHKVKGGPDNARDKLRNVWEPLFHLVKQPTGYYYAVDSVRRPPGKSRVINGAVVSATGVSGVRYRRQIELSTVLTSEEKRSARLALDETLGLVREGKLSDFRMVIRGQQRATHSDSELVSGRAKELLKRGYYFLKYHPNGSKVADVWDIIPEDTQRRGAHFAAYPVDLCRLPLLATCPPAGMVLDPFCGTGTTNLVAHQQGRKSVGVDLSPDYLEAAAERCGARV